MCIVHLLMMLCKIHKKEFEIRYQPFYKFYKAYGTNGIPIEAATVMLHWIAFSFKNWSAILQELVSYCRKCLNSESVFRLFNNKYLIISSLYKIMPTSIPHGVYGRPSSAGAFASPGHL